MDTRTIIQRLRLEGVLVWLEGDMLQYDGPKKAMTDALLSELRQHKPAIIALLSREGGQAPEAKTPAYIKRCKQCGGIRWGFIRTEYDILPSGEHRPYEAWGCLDCTGKQCPQCHGRNLVTDRAGTYCVDCLERSLMILTERQGV